MLWAMWSSRYFKKNDAQKEEPNSWILVLDFFIFFIFYLYMHFHFFSYASLINEPNADLLLNWGHFGYFKVWNGKAFGRLWSAAEGIWNISAVEALVRSSSDVRWEGLGCSQYCLHHIHHTMCWWSSLKFQWII